jgi:hypothetical protein
MDTFPWDGSALMFRIPSPFAGNVIGVGHLSSFISAMRKNEEVGTRRDAKRKYSRVEGTVCGTGRLYCTYSRLAKVQSTLATMHLESIRYVVSSSGE